MRVSPRFLFGTLASLVVLTHLRIHTYLHTAAPPLLPIPLHADASSPPPPPPSPPPPPPSPIAVVEPAVAAAEPTSEIAPNNPVVTDIATCEAASSGCLPCVRIKPRKPPDDSGVRCVWCGAMSACKGFVKGTEFPCTDAIRGGGGYPGGSHCPGGIGIKTNSTTTKRSRARILAAISSARASNSRTSRSLSSSSSKSILEVPPRSLAGEDDEPTAADATSERVRIAPLSFGSPATRCASARACLLATDGLALQ